MGPPYTVLWTFLGMYAHIEYGWTKLKDYLKNLHADYTIEWARSFNPTSNKIVADIFFFSLVNKQKPCQFKFTDLNISWCLKILKICAFSGKMFNFEFSKVGFSFSLFSFSSYSPAIPLRLPILFTIYMTTIENREPWTLFHWTRTFYTKIHTNVSFMPVHHIHRYWLRIVLDGCHILKHKCCPMVKICWNSNLINFVRGRNSCLEFSLNTISYFI